MLNTCVYRAVVKELWRSKAARGQAIDNNTVPESGICSVGCVEVCGGGARSEALVEAMLKSGDAAIAATNEPP